MDVYDAIIDEVTNLFKDNLKLLIYNATELINIKKYWREHDTLVKPLTYNELISFAEEALEALIDMPEWYDFRDLD